MSRLEKSFSYKLNNSTSLFLFVILVFKTHTGFVKKVVTIAASKFMNIELSNLVPSSLKYSKKYLQNFEAQK
jgi:hypothetical protein